MYSRLLNAFPHQSAYSKAELSMLSGELRISHSYVLPSFSSTTTYIYSLESFINLVIADRLHYFKIRGDPFVPSAHPLVLAIK